MGFTPYDWNENLQHRVGYVERRLREGSPVVGHAFEEGVLLLSIRRTQRKVFEVYDHILFSALGSQQDVEGIRISSINFAHEEGFNRSPDDVSVQRLVSGLSPILKRSFSDAFTAPFIFRGVFAELGRVPERDQFTTLNYDGEYAVSPTFAVVGSNEDAERRMREHLAESGDRRLPLQDAVRVSVEAWAEGFAAGRRAPGLSDRRGEEDESAETPQQALQNALKDGHIEVGVLERRGKQMRFRLLPEAEVQEACREVHRRHRSD